MTENGEATPQQLPAWANVDPRAVVVQLTNQLAGLIQQLAMRDAYIDQLHQALAMTTGAGELAEASPHSE